MEREGCQCECLKIPRVCFDPSDEELVTYLPYTNNQGKASPMQSSNDTVGDLRRGLMPWEVLKDDNPY